MRKIAAVFFLTCLIIPAGISPAFANDRSTQNETESREGELEDQILETAEELSVVILENLKEFLENELNKLKNKKERSGKAVRDKLASLEEIIKKHPDNAEAHFVLGEIYDQVNDGANAIIQTRKAEKLYTEQKNIKGMAESRRNLRNLYQKYGFQPEDFKLQP